MSGFQHKKRFGQHFLNDDKIAQAIVQAMLDKNTCRKVLEIGPGEGVLTRHLLESPIELYISEIDRDIVPIIREKFGVDDAHLIVGDFLQARLDLLFTEPFSIIGNFPYNISTEIIFKTIEFREKVPLLVGMFQKEVAERIAAKHGSKIYGVTSVLTQAYFDVEYLFTVDEHVFDPPPKVKSAVIRLTRKAGVPDFNHKALNRVVKVTFNKRRKMLRKAFEELKLELPESMQHFNSLRAEQLSVEEFIALSKLLPPAESTAKTTD